MRAELPTERLHRRLLGAATATGRADEPPGDGAGDSAGDTAGDSVGSDGCEQRDPGSVLGRWQPPVQQGWAERVRADPGRAGVALLTLIAAVAVMITVFTMLRDGAEPVAAVPLPPVQMATSATAAPAGSAGSVPPPESGPPDRSAGPAADDGALVVSVVGLVRTPGLVTLAPGARIADALHAAGDPLDGADTVGLNLARRVADGEQIVVAAPPPPGAAPPAGSSVSPGAAGPAEPPAAPGTSAAPSVAVDLNTATVAQLDDLPGVGPVTAAAIVAWRDSHGRFTSVDQLGEVDGIGPARLARLRPLVHV